MGLVLAMGLRAMGIADSIVNLAFGLTLGSVAVAFALAFGLGGRQPAERVLTDLIDKAKAEGNKPNPIAKTQSAVVVETPVASSPVAPSEAATDHNVPTTFDVDPAHKPLNNPYGSKGEGEDDPTSKPDDQPK